MQLRKLRVPAVVTRWKRSLVTGGATVQAIDRYVSKFHPDIMPRKRSGFSFALCRCCGLSYSVCLFTTHVVPRTGWSIPFVGFGSDGIGSLPTDRLGVFYSAAASKSCNLFAIDGGNGNREAGR